MSTDGLSERDRNQRDPLSRVPAYQRASDGAMKPATPSAQNADGALVLLVDDDAVARLLTACALTERGWQVVEAEHGKQALQLFVEKQPDVVVLDALMPELDGFAACERLRRLPDGEHVPVLMLTGLDDEASIARAYEAGATDFFVKTNGQWTVLSERLRYMLRAARMREELAQSQAKLTKAQRIARLGSWEWELAARWVRLSDECFQIAGLSATEEGLADWFVWSRVVEADRPRIEQAFAEAIAKAIPGEQVQLKGEFRVRRPSGQVRVVHVEAEVDFAEDATGVRRPAVVHGVLQDITERKQAEDKIRQLANFDSLTGLPNRRFFRDQFADSLDQARADGSHVAVLFIDVDRFKQVNDTLGHDVGDELLREIARRLHHAVRESDTVARLAEHRGIEHRGVDDVGAVLPALASPARTLAAGGVEPKVQNISSSVARLGGDEFTVLVTGITDVGVVERIATRLLETVRRPIACGGHEVFVSASIGVSVYPLHGDDVDTLIRKADIAMYSVKDDGRSGWQMFDDAMNAATAARWRIETALHRALERKELTLHFQPKIDVRSGAIVGAEALMRWHRAGELVPAAQFIGVAEDSGLIVPITEWAIDHVCQQILQWQGAGVQPVPVSINISNRHVQRADVTAPLQLALSTTGLPANLLELELTETVLMQNIDAALPLLQSLKQLGVSISIDDFGTGYSSLSYLKRLPIDILKIDRSFVRELESSDDSAAIVSAIIAMSRGLNLHVIAEGVETAGQMQRLHEQGCHLMQGWLFAPAVPAEEFLGLLQQQTPAAWRAGG